MNISQEQANRVLLWVGLIAAFGPLIVWPVTSLTVWKDQPQGVMALSWIAIELTGVVLLVQAITKRDIDS